MIISFSELPSNAKIWIFPSNRKFYNTEIPELHHKLETFVKDWFDDDTHIGFKIFYDRFLVFGVDVTKTIETSKVDALVTFIVSLQMDYSVVLLDKMNVCFKQGEYIQYKDLKEFQKLIKQKAVSKKTIVFDNLIENKQEFDEFWEVPITESWYNRFLK